MMKKGTLRLWQLALLVAVFVAWHLLTAPGLLPPVLFADDRQAAFFFGEPPAIYAAYQRARAGAGYPDVVPHARLFELGWDGETAVFEPNTEVMQTMARSCVTRGDHATRRWIHSDRVGRIFLAAYSGTLLLNFTPGRGYSIEPGSTASSRGTR